MMLNEFTGWKYMGELEQNPGVMLAQGHRRSCACTELINDCPFWSRMATRVFGDDRPFAPGDRLKPSDHAALDSKYIPELLKAADSEADHGDSETVFIDSSKRVSTAQVLARSGIAEQYFVLLMRQPHGVVNSRVSGAYRPKARGRRTENQLIIKSRKLLVAKESMYWRRHNLGLQRYFEAIPEDRKLIIRYEDYVEDPAGYIERVVQMVQPDVEYHDEINYESFPSQHQHAMRGNNLRTSREPIKISLDTRWQEALPGLEKRIVSVITSKARKPHRY